MAGTACRRPGPAPPVPLPRVLDAIVRDYTLDSCWQVGVAVVSLGDDSLLFGAAESVPMVPASNVKLLTVACALEYWDDSLVAAVERRLARSRLKNHARLLDPARAESLKLDFPAGPAGYRYLVWTNHVSDNRLAEWLLAAAAARAGLPTGRLFTRYLADRDIPAPGFDVRDGSGRSPLNRVAAVTLARLLSHLSRSEHGPLFVGTLPAPGTNSTLRGRGLGVGHRVRAKTGYIRASFALAGCLDTGPDTVAFSLIANNCPHGRSAYRFFTRMLLALLHHADPVPAAD